MVYIPFPDMGTALKNKAIDATFPVEPFVTFISEKGFGLKWIRQSDIVKNPYQDIAGIAFNTDWAEKNRELAIKFMMAWLKGAREYLDASRHKPNRKEVVMIMTKYTSMKDPALYDKMEWAYVNPNGFVNRESLADQIRWYHDNGFLEAGISVEKFIDHSYLERALERLGRYPEPPVQ
mgnify:CR=1 FL=1